MAEIVAPGIFWGVDLEFYITWRSELRLLRF